MSYLPNRFTLADGPNLDAFSRLRVSNPFTQFDSTFQYAPATFANQLSWDVSTTGGSASVQANQCSVRISTGAVTAANEATIQSKKYSLYQPGKSRLVLFTFACSAAVTNSRFEIGYADAENGILFQRITGASVTTNYITRRTKTSGSVVDTGANAVAQANWNLDTLDGNGRSGLTIDFTKTNILVIDLQFLGVGRVRVGFDIDGGIVYAHEFDNANSLTVVYMSTGSLPVRARVVNTGTSSGTLTADIICTSVISEGGFEGSRANQFSAGNGVTAISTTTTLKPLVTIRPIATFNSVTFRGHIVPLLAQISVTAQIHEYQLVRNAALTGASFGAADATYSAAQFDVSSSAMSGGVSLDRGYVIAGGSGANAYSTVGSGNIFSDDPLVQTSLGNVLETLTLGVRAVTSTGTAYGSLTWQERY